MSSPQVWTQVRTWGRAPDLVCVPESPLNTHGEGGEQGGGEKAPERFSEQCGGTAAARRCPERWAGQGWHTLLHPATRGVGERGRGCLEGLCWWGQ